jgi:hypothetical protein
MSQYLIRRITEIGNITLHLTTEIQSLDGDQHLQRVIWKTSQREPESHAVPPIEYIDQRWRAGCVNQLMSRV